MLMMQQGGRGGSESRSNLLERPPARTGRSDGRTFFFEKDKLTPSLPTEWLRGFLSWTNTFGPAELMRKTRRELGYTEAEFRAGTGIALGRRPAARLFLEIQDKLREVRRGLANGSGMPAGDIERHWETEGMLKVELAFCLLKLCYGNAPRKSVDPATSRRHLMLSHPLRAGMLAAWMGPVSGQDRFDNVLSDHLHDLREDTRDKRAAGIRFVVPKAGEPGLREILSAEEQFAILEMLFSPSVARDVRVLTREKSRKYAEDNWEAEYQAYLSRVKRRPSAQRTKSRDLFNNGEEMDTIVDRAQKAGVIRRTVLKMAWDVPFEKKVSWRMSELLLQIIERYSEDPGLALRLRRITEKDVKDFEAGLVIAGERKFAWKLLSGCPDQGVPVITIFHERRGRFVAEIPYLDGGSRGGVEKAERIVRLLMGKEAGFEQAQTMTNQKMRMVVFFEFSGSKAQIERNARAAVELYDFYLKKIIPEAMKDGREAWASRTRSGRFYEAPGPRGAPDTPSRGSGGLPESPALQEFLAGPGRMQRTVLPDSGTSLRHRSGRFHAARPL